MMRTAHLLFLAFLGFCASLAHAVPAASLRVVATGLTEPVAVTNAGDGSGRLFVVERAGFIRIVRGATVQALPFLDLSARVGTSGERGLLGLAFHPQYSQNRRFYVYYTAREDGAIRVSSFVASAGDPDRADAASEQILVTAAHALHDNHNGGQIAFGPDGYLYAGTGDGGGTGDPENNAQNPASLLGKLLRFDVNSTAPSAQVWALGLRNPWRFSFDRATGDLFIGDVGQDRFEEMNFASAATPAGRNYGWPSLEGNACYKPLSGCTVAGMTAPVLTYGRDKGKAIIGGYSYRGTRSRPLYGYYVYGDFDSGRIWAARQETVGSWSNVEIVAPGNGQDGLSAFGEDESGELFVLSLVNGRLYALDATPTARTDPGVVSGLWWNPSESGWGVQFTQRGDIFFATLYNYGPDGQPKWYIASNCQRTQPPQGAVLRCVGALYETSGPNFFSGNFNPAAIHVNPVGSLDVSFRDSERGSMSFTVGNVTRAVQIQRQVFGPRSVALSSDGFGPIFFGDGVDHTDLYFNPNESGWGLAVAHQGIRMFVTWYVYDSAGRPEWYVASDCSVQGSSCAGEVYRVTGPPLAATFDPSQVRVTQVGFLSLDFDPAGGAVLNYNVNGLSATKTLQREQF